MHQRGLGAGAVLSGSRAQWPVDRGERHDATGQAIKHWLGSYHHLTAPAQGPLRGHVDWREVSEGHWQKGSYGQTGSSPEVRYEIR